MHDNLDMYWDDIWREEHELEPDFSSNRKYKKPVENKDNRIERIKNKLFDSITSKSWLSGYSSPIIKYGWIDDKFVIKSDMHDFTWVFSNLSYVLNDDHCANDDIYIPLAIKIGNLYIYMDLVGFANEYGINLEDIFPKEKYDYNRWKFVFIWLIWRIINMEIRDKEQFASNLKAIMSLEVLGIHVEDVKEKDFRLLYYFSVPEKSTIKNNENSNYDVTTSDGLIEIAKTTFTEIIIESCKSEFGNDEEFYEEVENNISDYASFFAKVRKGEVWDEEMGRLAVDKFLNEIENNSYKQV